MRASHTAPCLSRSLYLPASPRISPHLPASPRISPPQWVPVSAPYLPCSYRPCRHRALAGHLAAPEQCSRLGPRGTARRYDDRRRAADPRGAQSDRLHTFTVTFTFTLTKAQSDRLQWRCTRKWRRFLLLLAPRRRPSSRAAAPPLAKSPRRLRWRWRRPKQAGACAGAGRSGRETKGGRHRRRHRGSPAPPVSDRASAHDSI